MENQKKEVISFVQAERERGRLLADILKNLKVSRSTYYRWIKLLSQEVLKNKYTAKVSIRTVTEEERALIDDMKEKHPEMRHRQIQGSLQLEGTFVSATTVYKYLKANNKVEHYERRSAPRKEPHYEIFRANVMWGADWTKLRIGGIRWYLLTMIDFFSRLIVHYEITPTVNAGHIKELYENGLGNFNIPLNWHLKPELRLDQGSPNTSRVTKEFFKYIGADLSYARVRRPTDNALTERFYRIIKQEEIYIVGDYQDEPTAKEVIGKYIQWYNNQRPHQALWNYTPQMVHEMNDKTKLVNALKDLKQKTWTERKEYWLEKNNSKYF